MDTPHRVEGPAHWDEVYRTRPADQVSWHQPSATTSLRLLAPVLGPGAATRSVVDVGAGASVLVDGPFEDAMMRAGLINPGGPADGGSGTGPGER